MTIYRLISEFTIEENILMKNIQKTKLDTYVMEKGEFNQETLSRKVKDGLLSSTCAIFLEKCLETVSKVSL